MTAESRERFLSFSRSSTMSPSTRPAMIWSRMFFWVHASEQKLQVLASSRRDTRKSSNVSPSCWTRLRNLRRSTDSLICPCMYRSMAAMISVVFRSCSVVRPRLSTIVTVSREKHSVRAWTCLAFDWLSSPDRLKYASHNLRFPRFEVRAAIYVQIELR